MSTYDAGEYGCAGDSYSGAQHHRSDCTSLAVTKIKSEDEGGFYKGSGSTIVIDVVRYYQYSNMSVNFHFFNLKKQKSEQWKWLICRHQTHQYQTVGEI
jgi:hypothetical protein